MTIDMSTPRWSQLLREHGDNFLSWTAEHSVLKIRGSMLAKALGSLLFREVVTSKAAGYVWAAVPAVLGECNNQSTYELPFASVAYAWLHFLERYTRIWRALEILVQRRCFPLAKYDVRVLDVGTGPGPSAFAVHDFYKTLVEFSHAKEVVELNQPSKVDCVEYTPGMNRFRHHLAELVHKVADGPAQDSVLNLCWSIPDFRNVYPREERAAVFRALQREEDRYYDEIRGEWVWEPQYTSGEANQIAQSLRRYRLFVFSNFLTTEDTVEKFRANLHGLLSDAGAGSVMLLLGGSEDQYPRIYHGVDEIASICGFERQIENERVSSKKTALSNLVYEEGQRFYEHVQSLSYNRDKSTVRVHQHFRGGQNKVGAACVRAYRKNN